MTEKKVCVNYDAVMRTLEFLAKINHHSLGEIEWVRDSGDTIAVDDRLADAWRLVGLNNVNFAQYVITDVLAGKEAELIEEFASDVLAGKEEFKGKTIK